MKYEITKGSEKDFVGAPEGALYVLSCIGEIYYSVDMVQTLCGLDISDSDHEYIIAERRPITEPAWSGEGLPPVGVECEIKYGRASNAEWIAFRCVGVDCGVAFGWAGNEAVAICKESYEFRPIRSPEDAAREKITLNMLQYMYSSDETDHAQVCKIYDAIAAGKIPGVKLE